MFENCTVKYLAEKGVNVGVKVTYPKKEDGSTFSKSIPYLNRVSLNLTLEQVAEP